MNIHQRDILDWINLVRSILLAAGIISILLLAAVNHDQRSRPETGVEMAE